MGMGLECQCWGEGEESETGRSQGHLRAEMGRSRFTETLS